MAVPMPCLPANDDLDAGKAYENPPEMPCCPPRIDGFPETLSRKVGGNRSWPSLSGVGVLWTASCCDICSLPLTEDFFDPPLSLLDLAPSFHQHRTPIHLRTRPCYLTLLSF
jgi:hypothetical protein